MLPAFLLGYSFMLLESADRNDLGPGFAYFISYFMFLSWTDRIIPVTSIYQLNNKWNYIDYDLMNMYYDGTKLSRRSETSGYRVCHAFFLIYQLIIIIAHLNPAPALTLHISSVYYWVLGLLHVRHYDSLRHDEVYLRFIKIMDNFSKRSIFGFVALKRAKGRGGPFFPIIALFWILAWVLFFAFTLR